MIVIPMDDDAGQRSYLLVVIEKDNFERMQKADPITLDSAMRGGTLSIKYPDNFTFCIAYEDDAGPVYELARKGKIKGLLDHIMRGYGWTAVDGKRVAAITGPQQKDS